MGHVCDLPASSGDAPSLSKAECIGAVFGSLPLLTVLLLFAVPVLALVGVAYGLPAIICLPTTVLLLAARLLTPVLAFFGSRKPSNH